MTREPIYIEFHPRTFNAFQGKQGLWSKYDLIQKAGITSLTGTLIIQEHAIDTDHSSVDLDFYFDPDSYDTEKFGLVYGDGQFEQEVSDFIAQTFPVEQFGSPCYTEMGMQTDEYVSMEFSSRFAEAFRCSSAHSKIELFNNPTIAMWKG